MRRGAGRLIATGVLIASAGMVGCDTAPSPSGMLRWTAWGERQTATSRMIEDRHLEQGWMPPPENWD